MVPSASDRGDRVLGDELRFFRASFAVFALLSLLAAFFSTGFHQCDEHYQTLEFAWARAGLGDGSKLPWEFTERMRPFLQPAIYSVVLRALRAAGWGDPFIWATLLRLLTVALALPTLYLWSHWMRRALPAHQWRIAVLVSFFAFYVPYLTARTSSETWSGLCLVLSLVYLLRGYPEPIFRWRDIVAGATALGLCFLFRYQSAFCILGLLGWLVFGRGISFGRLLTVAGIALGVVAFGVLVDRWGYGSWTLTAWNYFRINVLENKAANFGVLPWWGYFRLYTTEVAFPFGLLLFLTLFVFWAKFPRHVLTWVTGPFVLAHFFLAHKEPRFLFPVVYLMGAITALVWGTRLHGRSWTVRALLFVNAILLFKMTLTPAKSFMPTLEWIYRQQGRVSNLYLLNENPFILCNPLPGQFYWPTQMEITPLTDPSAATRGLVYENGLGTPRTLESLARRCRIVKDEGIYRWIPEKWRERSWAQALLRRNYFERIYECP